ncbi:DUF5916 domain-containing protein [Cytophagaceae bacterium ABcell3]|nr:DUF5916 domain-containing protein [Cytophagaceae bacterium ABcell3]
MIILIRIYVFLFVGVFLHLFSLPDVLAGDGKKRVYRTAYTETPPTIDGQLDDEVWDLVSWQGDFTQRYPHDGQPPSQKTKFKILYDKKNLYVAVKAYDDDPSKIVKRMSRRDGFEGDLIQIQIDSYFDHRTAFSFGVSAIGVKNDEIATNDGDHWDTDWDPVWYVKTSFDSEGWNAEMRIPLSQLRFTNKDDLVWGLQVARKYFREDEWSMWQAIPQGAAGYVHRFGELRDLKGIKPQRQVEVQPYLLGQAERFEKEPGNPYATGRSYNVSAGVDGKIGITSDITLDFTLNPDFGQVEADPSMVNLTAYRLFFEERREFFKEGRNILDFQIANSAAGGEFNNDNLFYSRRIGGTSRYFPQTGANEYMNHPQNSSILSAVKLTGKDKNGLSWGILQSATATGVAEIDSDGQVKDVVVDPFTNFLVGRVQKDINDGNTVVGAMLTSVNRKLDEPHLNFLHREAYTGGFDFLHHWKDRNYYVSLKSLFSHVAGDEESIIATQTSGERFFQRPDARHLSVDSSLTSLTGSGGTFKLGKNSGNLLFQTGLTWRSPGLELNDIGFLRNSDQISQWSWLQYRITKAWKFLRNFNVVGLQQMHWDFQGVNIHQRYQTHFHTQFTNFWYFGSGVALIGENISNADLRGGPGIKYPGGTAFWYYGGTDNRKKVSGGFNNGWFFGKYDYQTFFEGGFYVNYRPFDALNISLHPNFEYNRDDQQYVATASVNGENRYITGTINQRTYSMAVRLMYNITPDLTIEFWGQPFLSTGRFEQFKSITSASAEQYTDRFDDISPDRIVYEETNNVYKVDETGNYSPDYNFDNPDFDFIEFRSNLVMRWEYTPGSTLFLVWAQGKTDTPLMANPGFRHLSEGLFRGTAHNTFLIKYTYRFRL